MRGIRASLAVSAAMNVPPLIMTFWAPWRTWFPLMLEVWQMRRRKEVRTWGAIKPQVDHDVLSTFCQGTPSVHPAQHFYLPVGCSEPGSKKCRYFCAGLPWLKDKRYCHRSLCCGSGLLWLPFTYLPIEQPSITTTETLSQWSCQPSLQAQAGDPESSQILLTSHPVEIPFCTVLAFEHYVWFLLTAYTHS